MPIIQYKAFGGVSGCRKIRIFSHKFAATAQFHKNGNITCKIGRFSIFSIIPVWQVVFVAISVCVVIVSKYLPDTNPSSELSGITLLGIGFTLYVVSMTVHLVYHYFYIATWHGAEHMAVSAYENFRSTDIEVIAKQGIIDDECGAKYLLPFLILFFTMLIVEAVLGVVNDVNWAFDWLVIIVLVVLFDALVGLSKIPVILRFSRFFQKVTTRKPGRRELLTAQVALKALVAAHQNDGSELTVR